MNAAVSIQGICISTYADCGRKAGVEVNQTKAVIEIKVVIWSRKEQRWI